MSNRRNTSRPRRKPWAPYLQVPPFLPVPVRTRKDGWTPARQARFVALLVRTACVRKAAQAIGLTRDNFLLGAGIGIAVGVLMSIAKTVYVERKRRQR